MPSSGIMAGGASEQNSARDSGAEENPGMPSKVSTAFLREADGFPSVNGKKQSGKSRQQAPVTKIDPQNCSSEFMRKLTPRQQIASVDRLTKSKDWFATQKPAQRRQMTRALSTARPPDKIVKPTNTDQEGRRQSGRYFNANASVKYKTVTGKMIDADRIENTSRRLSMPGL